MADDALGIPETPHTFSMRWNGLSQWLDRAVQEGRAALHSLRASTTQSQRSR